MDVSDGWAPYLTPGERILWEGRPTDRLFVFRPFDIFFVPFSVIWALFAVRAVLPQLGGDVVFTLFGLFFLAVAAYATVGRFFLDRYVRRHAVYALTNKRALIARSAFGRRMRDMPITPALSVEFDQAPRGSIWFDGRPSLFASQQSVTYLLGDDDSFVFREIEAPAEIFALVQKIQTGDG